MGRDLRDCYWLDFYGWSSDDRDGISMGIMNGYYFTHQSDRLQQAMVNHVV